MTYYVYKDLLFGRTCTVHFLSDYIFFIAVKNEEIHVKQLLNGIDIP